MIVSRRELLEAGVYSGIGALLPKIPGAKRIFAAGLAHETNSFSPIQTGIESYRKGTAAPLEVARRRASAEGYTLIEGSCFSAVPSAPTNKRDYEFMRDEILGQIKAALPLDGVLLGLHGAMIAVGYDDVEGDIVERVRAIVGSNCVIGIETDPHCNLTVKRVSFADFVVLYKEYPHTDIAERAEDLLNLSLKAIRGEVRPVASLYDCRQLQWYSTERPRMRALVDRIKSLEGKDGVLSISIGHGFPFSDVPEVGTRVLVYTDNNKAKGDALARKIGAEMISMRGESWATILSVEDGITAALATPGGPVIIADTRDASGAGEPADNTAILRSLIDRRVEGAALGPLWDPIAVRQCFHAGEGAEFPLRIGGKIGPASGAPVDATVTVIGLKRDSWQTAAALPGGKNPLGDCAAVRIGGVEIVLGSTRTQAFGLDLFTNVGIDPRTKKIVVLKGSYAFLPAYQPISVAVIHVASNGVITNQFHSLPYKKIKRPIWPLDDNPIPKLIL